MRGQRRSAQQPAPTHRSQHHVERCSISQAVVFDEFFGGCGLSSNDTVVVERVNEHRTRSCDHVPHPDFAGLERGFALDDFGPVAPNGVFLDLRSGARHHNVGGQSHLPGGKGYGLRVVTRRMGRDRRSLPVGGYLQHGVQTTPRFESPDFLEVLALEIQIGPGAVVDGPVSQHGGAVDVGPDAVVGLTDGVGRNQW